MANPKGQVLFCLVIPRRLRPSEKHLSDRNLRVMQAHAFVANFSNASIGRVILSHEDEGAWGVYQRVKGVLITWWRGGLSTCTGPLVGTWEDGNDSVSVGHHLTEAGSHTNNTPTSWLSGFLLLCKDIFSVWDSAASLPAGWTTSWHLSQRRLGPTPTSTRCMHAAPRRPKTKIWGQNKKKSGTSFHSHRLFYFSFLKHHWLFTNTSEWSKGFQHMAFIKALKEERIWV